MPFNVIVFFSQKLRCMIEVPHMLGFSPYNIFQLLHIFIIFFAHRIVSNFVSNICINTVLSIILFHLFAYKCIYQINDFVWFNLKFIVIITKSKNKKLNKNLFLQIYIDISIILIEFSFSNLHVSFLTKKTIKWVIFKLSKVIKLHSY